MKKLTLLKKLFTSVQWGWPLLLVPTGALAQYDIPSPNADPSAGSDEVIPTGLKEVKTSKSKPTYTTLNQLSGSGFLLVAPQLDGGYISTSPSEESIFRKLESSASGWILEPKVGFGLLNQSVALDLLVGAQFHSLSGNKTGVASSFETETEPVTALEPAVGYVSEQTVPLVEGSARLRLGKTKKMSLGLTGTALFGASKALYSSVPEQGLKFGFFAGPQFTYQEQFKSSFLRIGATAQILASGRQRSGFVFKVGVSYSNLLNKPQLVEKRVKVIKEEVTTQRRIVSKREQILVQKENVNYMWDSQMINFKLNKSDLTEKSEQFVSGLGQIFAAQYSDWQSLIVEGHTDSQGNADYNKKLSRARAETVRDVLVRNGVPAVAITAIGRGEEKLLVKNEKTEVDFARNRRVELTIQGLRNARILQRSISALEMRLFGKSTNSERSDSSDDSGSEE